MSTIDNIVSLRYGSARALPPEYAGVPMRSPATSIVLAEAVKRNKRKSPSFLATLKAWLRDLIVLHQSEAPPQAAECR